MNNIDERTSAVVNGWKATTWLLAGLLAVSITGNQATAWRIAARPDGTPAAPVANPPVRAAAAPLGPQAPTPPAPLADVSADDDPAIGNKNAKVEVIGFLDYQCPFCADFHNQSFQQLKTQYIDKGTVRFVTRDFPLEMHQYANSAAIAADCVSKLSDDATFYRYQDSLYAAGDLSDASLHAHAVRLGIDGPVFDTCLSDADGQMAAEIEHDIADGQAAGVSGTPTFFINGRKVVGNQPWESFKQKIDFALKGH